MAGQTSVDVSDLVLSTGAVITRKHVRECQSEWHKIQVDGNGSGVLKMPFAIIFMYLSET